VQLPIVLTQLSISIIRRGTFHDDDCTGTFSGANTLGYSIFIPLIYETYKYIIYGKKDSKYLLGAYLVIFWVSKGDYAIVFYFFVIGSILLAKICQSKKTFKKSIVLIPIISMVIVGLSVSGFEIQKGRRFTDIINPFWWVRVITKDQFNTYGGSPRNLYFALTYVHLNENAISPIIGMGPGNYASYVAFRYMTEKSNKVYNAFGQIEKDHGDPYVDSQIIPIWGETGYLGIILFVAFLLQYYIAFKKQSNLSLDIKESILAKTCSIGSLYLLIGFYVNHFWEEQTIMITYFNYLYLNYSQNKNMIKI